MADLVDVQAVDRDASSTWRSDRRGSHLTGGSHAFIQVKVIENVFTPEQMQQIVRSLTDSLVRIEGENMRPVTWCVVEEVKSGSWGIAGNPLTTEDVRALAAGVVV
jgi:4-oxalocrotonate tautomerase